MIGDNIFQQVQNAQQTAGNVYNNMATQGLSPTAYQDFMNPYVNDVIRQAQDDNERARQMAMNTSGAQAESQNAYGGSRSGIVDAMTNAEYDRNALSMAAAQRMQGYNNAQNLAQRDMGYRQQGASNLQSMGNQMFGQGQYGIQQQQRASDMAMRQQQQLLDAARAQTLANLGYPRENLSYYSSIFGGQPRNDQVVGETPGLFDILSGVGSIPFLPFNF
ncbi:protein of unknown function [uncultured Mediterranean phage uvMED]|nr:protein of unknown function [uncultured Mediterranean phage uvMED]BAR19720.1 protein of unknown function [uncultured Mediterranean phage uvMED]BAR19785.1 protein of unknown function [uncultured Mediterranean phage uvMED]